MKLQFRHQPFQADAAKAVCDVYAGQPFRTPTYMIDSGTTKTFEGEKEKIGVQLNFLGYNDFTGFSNAPVAIDEGKILEHIRTLQRQGGIKPSDDLDGRYNLTIEMETGVGKTYTYIKTMYELNKQYGWSKFWSVSTKSFLTSSEITPKNILLGLPTL